MRTNPYTWKGAVVWVLLCAAALVLPGCATIFDPAAEEVAKVVDKYCQEPVNVRRTVRENFNPTEAGNTVTVDCAVDAE